MACEYCDGGYWACSSETEEPCGDLEGKDRKDRKDPKPEPIKQTECLVVLTKRTGNEECQVMVRRLGEGQLPVGWDVAGKICFDITVDENCLVTLKPRGE